MLSELRARPAPLLLVVVVLLLLLASVLSETLAAKRDHISFVIGPFRPRRGPPSDPEPRGPSLLPGALGKKKISGTRNGPARRVLEPRGPSLRLSSASSFAPRRVARVGHGWLRPLHPCCPGGLFAQLFSHTPNSGCRGVCAGARASPSFSALPPLPPPRRTPVIGD